MKFFMARSKVILLVAAGRERAGVTYESSGAKQLEPSIISKITCLMLSTGARRFNGMCRSKTNDCLKEEILLFSQSSGLLGQGLYCSTC
jgi:hypothetical protein